MLCLVCGAEMKLVQVVKDTRMFVSGYEHHTWQCSVCPAVERRMTFAGKSAPTMQSGASSKPTSILCLECGARDELGWGSSGHRNVRAWLRASHVAVLVLLESREADDVHSDTDPSTTDEIGRTNGILGNAPDGGR
jgi:hypothetical protein